MDDHLFPRYHVRPPTGHINDPNGPILVDGIAHLYFQHRRELDHNSPVQWGHVSSPDFVHWTYHQPAIAPHPLHPDRDGCWSGNTVLDSAGAVRAFYSGHYQEAPPQKTLSAVSADGGYSFGPPRQVVPDPAPSELIQDLRDPFVWREGSSWRMVLGAGTSTGIAMVRLYASDDLETWEYQGPLVTMPRTRTAEWDSGQMWECPQVLSAGDALVAVVGSWSRDQGVMDVLSLAAPDAASGPRVEPRALHLVDHGSNFYAASVLRESDHGTIMWGWATEGRAPEWSRADNWSGVLTLPRVITVREDGALSSMPMPGLATLRAEPTGNEVSDTLDGLSAQIEFLLEGLDSSSGAYGIRLCFGNEEYLLITVDSDARQVSIDRDHASRDSRAHGGVLTITDPVNVRSPLRSIRGFVDGSILELFLPGGRVATTRFYPTSPPPWRLELVRSARTARAVVWELTSRDHNAGRPTAAYRQISEYR